MADFCKQCSEDLFGEDCGDLSGLSTHEDTQKGMFAVVLCEGCGQTQVNDRGVNPYCLKRHGKLKPLRQMLIDSLKSLKEELGYYDQTTHGRIVVEPYRNLGDRLRSILFLKDANNDAFDTAELSYAIDEILKQCQDQ